MSDVVVTDRPEQDRYEVTVDGKVAGFAAYRRHDERIVFTHTEVDSAFEGQGLGGKLASGALRDAKGRGLTIVAQCSFIESYLRRHPELAS